MSDQRCINCGLKIFRMRRHPVESDDVRSLLREWTSLSEIPNDSVVCHNCWLLIEQSCNSDNTSTARVGHLHLCVGCGHSLHRIRSHILNMRSERESAIRQIIEEQIAPRQLRLTDEICHPCWQRTYRIVQRNIATVSRPEPQPSTSSDV